MTVPQTTIADSSTNPYTAETELGPYQGPNPDYAVPEHEDAPYFYEGWANPYRYKETPEQDVPVDLMPNPESPNVFWGRRGRDTVNRHSVEKQDADGWTIQKDGLGKRSAPDPRLNPPPEPRYTQQMSPNTYSFVRPFDQTPERQFNGVHFSMADHRRDYEIGGMTPAYKPRNTYRIEPAPWDKDIVDMPPNVQPDISERIVSVDVPPTTNRSWRL